jgi:hypothetical protein
MRKLLLTIAISIFIFTNLNARGASVNKRWSSFKSRGIKTIKLTHVSRTNTLKVHMKGIKMALERAGIHEKVSIYLYVGGKKIANLGTYSPNVKDDGEHGDKVARKVLFKSMPAMKNVRLSKSQKAPASGKVVLVFKNSRGANVARLTANILRGKAAWKNNTSIPR